MDFARKQQGIWRFIEISHRLKLQFGTSLDYQIGGQKREMHF
jgi:hypothetical protein